MLHEAFHKYSNKTLAGDNAHGKTWEGGDLQIRCAKQDRCWFMKATHVT